MSAAIPVASPRRTALKSPSAHRQCSSSYSPPDSPSGLAHYGSFNTQQGVYYVPKVSFETFTAQNTDDFSFTLQSKSASYKHTRRSRTFVVCTDNRDYSSSALDWLMESLVENGDEVVALRILPIEGGPLNKMTVAKISKQVKNAREQAHHLMQEVMAKNSNMSISISVEFMVGKPQECIQRVVSMYKPDSLIVGCRGLSKMKTMFLGSISKYCLQHSPVPVTVVRPQTKIQQSLKKRLDPQRSRSYITLLEKSQYPAANLDEDTLAELSSPAINHTERKRGSRLDPNDLIAGPMGAWIMSGHSSYSTNSTNAEKSNRRQSYFGGWLKRNPTSSRLLDTFRNRSQSSNISTGEMMVDDSRSVKSDGFLTRRLSMGSFGSLGLPRRASVDLRQRVISPFRRNSLDSKQVYERHNSK